MKAYGIFESIDSLLGVASFAVVAIAAVLAGYKIAFRNRRLAEAARVMVGGLLVGGACQVLRAAL